MYISVKNLLNSSRVHLKNSLKYLAKWNSSGVYPFDKMPAAELGFEKYSYSSEILFVIFLYSPLV